MLPGYRGHLVSEVFLETKLAAVTPVSLQAGTDVARKQVAAWRRLCCWLGPASTVQTLFETAAVPLFEALGFDHPTAIARADSTLIATIRAGTQTVALVVAPWGDRLDVWWRLAVTQAIRRSAAWSLLFNGTQIRIVDASRLYTRRFLEFDIDLALDNERVFAAFWSLAHVTAFSDSDTSRRTRLQTIVEASQRHASAVSRALRDGVLAAATDILIALLGLTRRRSAPASLDGAFEQALTIVYRMLFLLFAEARGLVPLWHPVYRESYSLESLCSAAERPETATGLWDGLRAMARLAHAGCRAGDLHVSPFNGRLFAPGRTPLAERRDLDDQAARRAVLALSTRPAPDRAGRETIAYRDLGVEQLGAVYETLLEYQPRLSDRGNPSRPHDHRPSLELVRGSGLRKATGSFYTPQPIADYLIRRTLGPLVRNAPPERILQLRVVDPAMGSGAFLVAACRYLGDAYEAALLRSGGCLPSDFREPERVAIRRLVAERCLYGVDVNPMAAQLARLSLWLATLAADRPLTFLDHHLQTGDSLLGAWLANLRWAPTNRRPQKMDARTLPGLFDSQDVGDALRTAVPIRFRLEATPGDTLDSVRMKERELASLNRPDTSLSKWKRVADLWCAPWFATSDQPVPSAAFNALADFVLGGSGSLPQRAADHYLRAAAGIADSRRLFHWELEFPEVFFGTDGGRLPNGGFDAIIGNPPWDMVRADAGSSHDRARSRDGVARFLRFTRDSGVYTAQSAGHANRYQLFAERSIALAKRGGRLGLVLPSGFATDHGSVALRRRFLDECDLDALVGFENHHGIFPIHRSVRFLLLTAIHGAPTQAIACRMGERDPACLETVGEEPAEHSAWFPFHLSRTLLERVSGKELAIPDLRHPIDVSIIERVATLFAPLGSPGGCGLHFGRELNATDDRGHFGPPGGGWPVVEGKLIEPFRVDIGSARHSVRAEDIPSLLDRRRCDRARLAYRDVAGATNRLTLIGAILPARCVSTHTLFCLRTRAPLRVHYFLCGLFNSFVLNYLVRLRVTTHVTTAIVEGLPIPRPDAWPRAFREISALARLLSRRIDHDSFARLQALVARLYQLTVPEFEHVLGTFPLVAAEERAAALQAFATEIQRPQR